MRMLPAPAGQAGQVERVDGEYTRHSTASLFMVCEPLADKRHVTG